MSYDLRSPSTTAEWAAYHQIRKSVLFDRRGRGADYDPSHPDETRESNHPLVLYYQGSPLGVIRVDVDGRRALFRRVAIREADQRRGHGRELLTRAELFARERGCTLIESHVNRDAVGFYARCGFTTVATESGGTVLMRKEL